MANNMPVVGMLLVVAVMLELGFVFYFVYRIVRLEKFRRWFSERGAVMSRQATLKSALIEQRRENLRFNAMLDASPDGFIRTDLLGKVTYWSAGATKILGWEFDDFAKDETIGNSEIGQSVKSSIEEAGELMRSGEKYFTFQEWLPTKSGKKVFCLINIAPVISTNGRRKEAISYVANLTDLTEIKKMSERLVASKSELAEANLGLERMIRLASHDLQEPLRIIITYLDLLKEEMNDGDEKCGKAIKYADIAQAGAYSQRRLINSLMQLYQFKEGAHDSRPFNMEDAVNDALDSLSVVIDESNAAVNVDANVNVEADKAGISQLLVNLIGNSIKYRDKERPCEIEVEAKRRATGGVDLLVRDNGIGVPDWFLDDIGQPFKRAYKRSEYEGTGLGLSVVKQIAGLFEGDIQFVNRDQGLSVIVKGMRI